MRLTIWIAAAVLGSTASAQHPALFRDLDFPAAEAAAKAEDKLLLLDAMTSWCGPCKVMDKTTWVDPEVVSWVAAHAVAIQLDMDEHEALKNALAIKAFPTMIVFKDGAEFDRVIGLRTPAEMLIWLAGARSGEREIDRVRADLAELVSSGEPRLQERMQLASAAASLGALEEAGSQLLWLWRRQPADDAEARLLARWRAGPGRNLAAELGGKHRATTAGLRSVRDELSSSLSQEDARRRSEWMSLNQALGEADATLAWAASLAGSAEGRAVLRQHESQLFEPLVGRGYWAVAGHTLADPLERVRFLGENLGAYDVRPADAADTGSAGGSIPAIPLGGMRPAERTPVEPGSDGEPAPEKPKTIPAIPLGTGGMQPARPAAAPKTGGMPAIPMMASGATSGERPTSPEAVAREVRARLTHQLRQVSARRYAALLAAERRTDAEAVAAALLQYADDDASRAALVSCALRAGVQDVRRDAHLEWLNAIARGAGE